MFQTFLEYLSVNIVSQSIKVKHHNPPAMKSNFLLNSILYIFLFLFLQNTNQCFGYIKGTVTTVINKTKYPVPDVKIIIFNAETSIEVYSDDLGSFLVYEEINFQLPFNLYAEKRGFLPTLIENCQDQEIVFKLRSMQSYSDDLSYSSTNTTDTSLKIRLNVLDTLTNLPIGNVIAHIQDFPFYAISNDTGFVEINLSDIEIVNNYENNVLNIILDHKGYNTTVLKIDKTELDKKGIVEKKDVHLKALIYLSSVEDITYNIMDLENRLNLTEVKIKDTTKLTELKKSINDSLTNHLNSILENTKKISEINSNIKNDSIIKNFIEYIYLPNTKQLRRNDSLLIKNLFDSTYYSIHDTIHRIINQLYDIKINSSIRDNDISIIKSTTESLYKSYIASEEMPDNGWRIYSGYNYGFKNRLSGSHFFKIGLKKDFDILLNKDKFYFDAYSIFNLSQNRNLEQLNLELVYRLINRKEPYISFEVGGGMSLGEKYLMRESNALDTVNKIGFAIDINLSGQLFGKSNRNNNFTKNIYFYINMTNRFVFHENNYMYGLPMYGGGVIYNIPCWKKSTLNTASKTLYLSEYEKKLIYEINNLRINPPKYSTILNKKTVKSLILNNNINNFSKELKRIGPLSSLNPTKNLNKEITTYLKSHPWSNSGIDSMYISIKKINFAPKGFKSIYVQTVSLKAKITPQEFLCLLLNEQANSNSDINNTILDPKWTQIFVYYAGLQNGFFRYMIVYGIPTKIID